MPDAEGGKEERKGCREVRAQVLFAARNLVCGGKKIEELLELLCAFNSAQQTRSPNNSPGNASP